jgi:hypothetical protein
MPHAVSGPRLGRTALALCTLVLLAACAAATPEYGPSSPRNGAGQPVDPTIGTPLPGDAPISG